ncbi:hypothetical protein SASPL_137342 [Salvia splendens]|uniref:Uncharacterized protein n=1 Tax=Salvia splendens TaxID=180675 RepID=A0A8X8WU68_SALSN|nr:hypothetical protein SASPL_137342 [Salvia splendens]
MRRMLTYHLGSLLELVQGFIEERLQARTTSSYQKKTDFLETLLDLSEGSEIGYKCRHIGVGNGDKMAKLKAELKSVLGSVEEADISRLPYLQATIKEVFRYHPSAPMLAPHAAEEDTEVSGYIIPKDTKIFINFWAIDGRIQRVLSLNGFWIDFEGQHYELIPFGSGRKICPGRHATSCNVWSEQCVITWIGSLKRVLNPNNFKERMCLD